MVGVMALAISLALMAGTASAATGGGAKPQASSEEGTCSIRSLPSFIAQGEFSTAASVADVIEVSCNPSKYSDGAPVGLTASQLYDRCGHDLTWYDPNDGGWSTEESGPTFTVHLDADGNANVALIGGPNCMTGESLIAVDEEASPFETFVTKFSVNSPEPTAEGLTIEPSSQVEDSTSSGVITIAEAEFKGASEEYVRIGAKQLYNRCTGEESPKLNIIGEDRYSESDPEETRAIQLDNDGNGFVLLEGDDSCAEGKSLIEADLEESPFTTLEGYFTVEPPRPNRIS
jgi:hypothetical protein